MMYIRLIVLAYLLVVNANAATIAVSNGSMAFSGAGFTIADFCYDVYLIGGQSQMPGRGESPTSSPDSQNGSWICTDGETTSITAEVDDDLPCQCNDMVDQLGSYSSAWPSFTETYYTETNGKKVIFICVARGGSAVYEGLSPARDDWSTSGGLFTTATSWIDASLSYLHTNGYHYDLKGLLWGQGETEGSAINDETITEANYKTATESVFSRFRTEYGQDLKIFIYQTGDRTTETYAEIRSAQDDIAAEQESTYTVFTDAVNYISYGWMAGDGVHYTTAGYNNMGELSAAAVATILGY